MKAWHPLTKLTIASGLIASGWLLLDGIAEAPATVAAARLPPPTATTGSEHTALAALSEVAAHLSAPPRERITAALERPLFAPSRRSAKPGEPPSPAPVVEASGEPAEAAAAGPSFRLVGTVIRRGAATGLVARDGDRTLEEVAVGDLVEGWRVIEIGSDHLVVERDGDRERLSILR